MTHDTHGIPGVGSGAIHAQVGNGGHMALEQIMLDNIQHRLHLREYQHSMPACSVG